MRKGGGKAKGSAYERTVGKILTAIYYPDGDGVFQRIYSHPIPTKGEVRGDLVAMRRYRLPSSDVIGETSDVMTLDSTWPFTVECKCYQTIKPIFAGLYSKRCELWDWMDQAQLVATENRKKPLLVFRISRGADIAAVWNEDYAKMTEFFGVCPASTYLISYDRFLIHEGIRLFLLKDFLAWPDWGVYKLGATQYIKSIMPKGGSENVGGKDEYPKSGSENS